MKTHRIATILLGTLLAACAGNSGRAEPEADADAGTEPDAEVELEPELPATACNGSDLLCDRSYADVAYATTHNAMSSAESGWIGPNQTFAVPRQLEDGIRGLMLDTHWHQDEAYLCHSACDLGQQRLSDGLAEIRAFLEDHPREVITIIFEAYITAAQTEAAFAESGLIELAYTPPGDGSWPTLGEMIEGGRRLVVLTDEPGTDGPSWYLDVWQHAWDTDWSNRVKEDFSCDKLRGDSPDNPLFILNHFLTRPYALPSLAEEVNHNPFFIERAEQCRRESGQIPSLISVDFYEIGDVLAVVDALNSIE